MKDNKVKIHSFIIYMLSNKGISQTKIAEFAGVSAAYVNQNIRGVKNDKKIKTLVANAIGFKTWASLEKAGLNFFSILKEGQNFLEAKHANNN